MPSERAFSVELSMNWPKVIHTLREGVVGIMAEEVPLLVRGAAHEMVDIAHKQLNALIYEAPEPPSIWFNDWTDFSHPGVFIKVDPDSYTERRRDPHRLYDSVKAHEEVVGPDAIARAFVDPADFSDFFYPKKVELGGIGTRDPSRPIPFWRNSISEIKDAYPERGRHHGVVIAARINGRFA